MPQQSMDAIIRYSRLLALGSLAALLLAFLVKTVVLIASGQSAAAQIVILLIQSLPLLIFIPGLRKRHLRTYAWLCFVSLLYFIAAVLTAFRPGSLYYGMFLSLLCIALFCGLVTYINLARKHQGGQLRH